MQTGYPYELNPQTWDEEQRRSMADAHSSAWAQARDARNAFELAATKAELVATSQTAQIVEDLRSFLEGSLYSGLPWGWAKNYPTSGLNPSEIEAKALQRVRPHVQSTARELWGASAPKPKKLDGP